MARTIGIRVGYSHLIELTHDSMKKRNKIDLKLSHEEQRAQVMKTIVRAFLIQDLKMSIKEYAEVKIESLEHEEREKYEIINVRFATINDTVKVNCKFINLEAESKNKIYQYVPKQLKTRFLAFETAAHKIRVDNQNSVTTKIRPGKYDFMLLVRNKSDKIPWSQVSQTFTPIDMSARFEVGILNKEDLEKEQEYEREVIAKTKLRKDMNNDQNNFYDKFELNSNDEALKRIMYDFDIDVELDNMFIDADISNIDHITSSSQIGEKRGHSGSRSSSPVTKKVNASSNSDNLHG